MEDDWKPMNEAPRNGTPILAYCDYDYEMVREHNKLAPYEVHAECCEGVGVGYYVIVWLDGWYERDSYESEQYYIPGWWFLDGTDGMFVVNPVKWKYIKNI